MEKLEGTVRMQEVDNTEEEWQSTKTLFVRKIHNDT